MSSSQERAFSHIAELEALAAKLEREGEEKSTEIDRLRKMMDLANNDQAAADKNAIMDESTSKVENSKTNPSPFAAESAANDLTPQSAVKLISEGKNIRSVEESTKVVIEHQQTQVSDEGEAKRKEEERITREREARIKQIRENVAKAQKERDEEEARAKAAAEAAKQESAAKVEPFPPTLPMVEPKHSPLANLKNISSIKSDDRKERKQKSRKQEQQQSEDVDPSNIPRSVPRKSRSDEVKIKEPPGLSAEHKSVSAPSITFSAVKEQVAAGKKRAGKNAAEKKNLHENGAEEIKNVSSHVEEEKVSELTQHPVAAPQPVKGRIKPPPGLSPSTTPLQGVLIVLESSVPPNATSGEAFLTASVSKRDMYSVIDTSNGMILHRFEGTDSTRFAIKGLKLGKTTQLVLQSASGVEVPDCVASVTIPVQAPPVAPRLVTIVDRQRTSVKLKWSPPLEDGGACITGYEVELSESELAHTFKKVSDGPKAECTLNKLSVGHKYFARIRALNEHGASPYCQPAFCFTTMAATPSAPSAVRLVRETGSSAIVTWDPPEQTNGSDVDSYQVEMCLASREDFQPIYNDLPRERVEIGQLKENSTYKMRVRAHNSQGNSPWSPISEISTKSSAPKQLHAPIVLDQRGDPVLAIAYKSKITLSWTSVPGATFHVEAKADLERGKKEWETVYVGSASSISLRCDGNELYNGFLPGTRHLISVAMSNERGLGPRSEPCEVYVRPVPPAPPSTVPRVKQCDIYKGTMMIEFDSSPDVGGSPQVASIVELRPAQEKSASRTEHMITKRPSREMTAGTTTTTIQYFDSQAQLDAALARERPKEEPIPPARFNLGDAVDATYSEDGRLYRAEIVGIHPPKQPDDPYRYQVKFVGYENSETVVDSETRECLKKGDEVTAVLYDTTPGAHAAGSSFVVKEHLRRLPGEVVSSVKEGYFIKFKGRGVATQRTNAFDVFPVVCASTNNTAVASSVNNPQRTDSTSPNFDTSTSASPPLPTSTPSSSAAPYGNELPSDLTEKEWFEACETSDNFCVLKGLRPGASYEVRIAAASEGAGRGQFGPVHTVRMDPGPPARPESGPLVLTVKPSGKVDVSLSPPVDDGGSSVTGYQMQVASCVVHEVTNNPTAATSASRSKFVFYVPQSFQSIGQVFETSSASYVHPSGGESLVLRYRARNRIGWGPWSGPSLVQVPPGPPSSITDLEVQSSSSIGEKNNKTNDNSTSAVVSFHPPAKLNGSSIQGYVVQKRKTASLSSKQPEPWPESAKDGVLLKENCFRVDLNNLIPGASYEVRVQALSNLGASPWTTAPLRVPGIAPSAVPTQVKVVPKSHREFEATWDFPEQDETACGGESVVFEVQFVPFSSSKQPPATLAKDVIYEGQSSNKTFVKNSKTQLKPEASYWLRVRASNTKGSAPFTQWVNFTMPPAPSDVALASKLGIDRVIIRETSTSADMAINLVVDLLPSAEDKKQIAKTCFARVEIHEKGSSASFVFEQKQLHSADPSSPDWLTFIITTGELRSETTYFCRAQLVGNGGVRGELSRSVPFTTKPMPVSAVTASIEKVTEQQQKSRMEEQRKANESQGQAERLEALKEVRRRHSRDGKQPLGQRPTSLASQLMNAVLTSPVTVMMILLGLFCVNQTVEATSAGWFSVSFWIWTAFAVLTPLAHDYIFNTIIGPRKRSKKELEEEAIRRHKQQQQQQQQQQGGGGGGVDKKGRKHQVKSDSASPSRQPEPNLFALERIWYKRNVVMWFSGVAYVGIVMFPLVMREFADYLGVIAVGLIGFLLILASFYVIPGELRTTVD